MGLRSPAWRALPFFCLLLLLGLHHVQAVDRDEVLESNFISTEESDDMGDDAIDYIHDFPRYWSDGGTLINQLPIEWFLPGYDETVDYDDKGRGFKDHLEEYVVGLVVMIALAWVFALFTFLGFLGYGSCYCCCRTCCKKCCINCRAPYKYTKCSIWCSRISLILLTISMSLCYFVGSAANYGVSRAADRLLNAGNEIVDYVESYKSVVNASLDLADMGIDTFYYIEEKIHKKLPSVADVNVHKQCIQNAENTTQVADVLEAVLKPIQADINSLAALTEWDDLIHAIGNFSAGLKALPNQAGLQSQLVALNATLQAFPSPIPLKQALVALNTTLSALNYDSVQMDMASLNTSIAAVNTSHVKSKLTGSDYAESTLPDLNALISDLYATDGTNGDNTIQTLLVLNASVNTYPDQWQYATDLNELEASVDLVDANTLTMRNNLVATQNSLDGLPDFHQMISDMNTLTNARDSLNFDNYVHEIEAFETAMAAVPSTNTLHNGLYRLEIQINSFWGNFSLDNVNTALINLNNSFTEINCVTNIYDMVSKINSTVVIVGGSIVGDMLARKKEAYDFLDEIPNFQREISNSIRDLSNLNISTEGLPNWNKFHNDIDNITNTLGLISLSQTATDLRSLNASLHALPSFSPWETSLRSLNQTILSFQSQLTTTINELNTFSTSLADMTDLSNYTSNALNRNASLHALPPLIYDAEVYIATNPLYAANGLPANVRDPLVTQISFLNNNSFAAKPNSTSLHLSMTALNAVLGAGLTTTDTSRQHSESLRNEWNNQFSPTDPATGSLDILAIQLADQDLYAYSRNYKLLALNYSIANALNLDNAKVSIQDARASTNSDQINQYLNRYNSSDLSITDIKNDVISNLDEINNMVDKLPSIETFVNQTHDFKDRLTNAYEDLTSIKRDWYTGKGTGILDLSANMRDVLNEKDGYRLLITNMTMLVPFLCTIFMGALPVFCKKGRPPKILAIILWLMCPVFWLFTGAFVPVSAPFADHCPNVKSIVSAVLADETLSRTTFGDILNLTAPIDLQDMYLYYAHCEGDRPEFLDLMDDTDQFLADNNFNISSRFDTLENDLPNGFSLHPKVRAIRSNLTDIKDEVNHVVDLLIGKMDCDEISYLYNLIIGTLCTDYTRYISLLVCVGFCFGFLCWFGCCCGFHARWRLVPHYERLEGEDGSGRPISVSAAATLYATTPENDDGDGTDKKSTGSSPVSPTGAGVGPTVASPSAASPHSQSPPGYVSPSGGNGGTIASPHNGLPAGATQRNYIQLQPIRTQAGAPHSAAFHSQKPATIWN